ncbi:hypothetical protein AYI69_g2179 [Smittium culicis]|uniref:Uncharacterized protein n=1 Tax=Smittium culicis TaxID=133412 RepID=A0A1R1YN54_9FUNG|nr:hypothetical protein AYI69_g2179 [Smittium culicis]
MMDEEDINQVLVSQEQVKELTEMVRELLRERERNTEPEDPYVTKKTPLTNLTVYPELIEALPSIEEDFFRTPLTEIEKKEEIHSCPKSSSMNYLPPPLNDSISMAVKKAYTTLHGIQVALAQATLFANTMRVLLADVASMITQERLDNLHKGMELTGKLHQLIESENKPLMDQEKLDGLISSAQNGTYSKAAQEQTAEAVQTPVANNNHQQHSNFRGRGCGRGKGSQQPIFVQKWPSTTKRLEIIYKESAASPKNDTFRVAAADAPSDTHSAPVQEGYRGGQRSRHRILLQPLIHTKEDRWTHTSLGLEEIKSLCRTEEFKNGNADVDLQDVPRAPAWTVTQPHHFNQGLETSSDMGSITANASLGVSRRPPNFRRIQGGMQHKNQQNLIQVARAGVKNQGREIFDHTETSYHAFRNANQHAENDAKSSQFQGQGPTPGGLQVIECWTNLTQGLGELDQESSSNFSGSSPWKHNFLKAPRAKEH